MSYPRSRCSRAAPRRATRGATLLEVLVAILVLSMGLLGVAGLQTASLRYVQGGWARAAVAAAMSNFAERVRTNPGSSTTAYLLDTTQTTTPVESTACNTSDCSPDELAAMQLNNWRVALNASMPGAAALVTGDRSTGYQATIIWLDRANTSKNASTGAETRVATTICTGAETGMAARTCCPAAASAPAGAHCTNFTVLP